MLIVAAIDDTKSIFQFVKMLLVDGITLILLDVSEIANHGCCVALDRQNKQKLNSEQFDHVSSTSRCHRNFNRCLPYFVTYGHKCGDTAG
jgi:hypothetical protein